MKIAHFAVFAPNLSGQYATIKDLIKAERSLGIDAQFIDFGFKGETKSRDGLKDGEIETVHFGWATGADLLIRHSAIPPTVTKTGIPVLTALHGRPENSFLLEKTGQNKVIREVYLTDGPFFTFWPELVYPWSLVAGETVKIVTAPVDLERFKPEGFKHGFTGGPNIIICDMWREDTTPFNVLIAACLFKDRYCKDAKIHIYGAPREVFIGILKKRGYLGEIRPLVENIQTVYRAADIMITPQVIATRTVREALASGCPVVAGKGNKYTTYTANPRDTEGFAAAIANCWNIQRANPNQRKVARLTAEKYFNIKQTAKDMKNIFDEMGFSL